MLEREAVEPSTSPWASTIVMARKDGSTRFCIDYCKRNNVTQKDAYPLPWIDATLDTIHGSQWFSTLDLLSGYWQVEVDETDRQKTAFCMPEGLFQFRVMPFGLCNAPATFQRLMNLVLAGLQWSDCLVYIKEVIVLGRTFDEHLRNRRSILQRLRESGFCLKTSKCSFFQSEVQYLDHIISRDGLATYPSKTEKVTTWPTPSQFLRFAGYYRRFVKDFAQIARPLHQLTERLTNFVWTTEYQDTFDKLRRCLTSAPILAYPDFSRQFILDTDASDTGIGAVLLQVDGDDQERVIAYGSRLLTKPERWYCVTRRELLAVVTFTKQYHSYLTGQRFSCCVLTMGPSPGCATSKNLRVSSHGGWRGCRSWTSTLCTGGVRNIQMLMLSHLPCRQCDRNTHD